MSLPSNSALDGLTEREAKERVFRYGRNALNLKRRVHPALLFLKEFTSPLLLILIAVSVVSFFLGEQTNAIIILAMASISAVMDFVNTYRSDKAVERLIGRVRTNATVVREGVVRVVPAIDVVPGDILKLVAGNMIPADARVIEARDFFVNQSALTGESFPIEKRPDGGSQSETDETDAVFSGTSVVTGYATVRVEATGASTRYGALLSSANRTPAETDFERGIREFSGFILRLNFLLVTLILVANTLLGRGVIESTMFAVAIAIGLTPELLPVMLSVSLSRGSIRMSRKQVIVRGISAIENFGSMNVLCTDKTGTLTEDRITLIRHIDANGDDSPEVFLASYLNSVHASGVKNPIDEAIEKHDAVDISSYRKIEEVPFDFVRRRNSIVVAQDGKKILLTKGAPEAILEVSSTYRLTDGTEKLLDEDERKRIVALYDSMSSDGYRVLGIARKEIAADDYVYNRDDESAMTFLGFLSFIDPPKKSAEESINDLRRLGVSIKILTGDSELLTKRICADIGIDAGEVVLGKEIEGISDLELASIAERTTVFARVTPEQKEKIISVLRLEGKNVVGYLGDGINDVSALRAADVGISVSNGVDAAKDMAGILLLEKDLRVLRDGILEGRTTFQNTMKYLRMWLSSNFGNMFSMMGASIFLPFLPMRPEQVLLNNFLYDASQISLPSDRVDAEDVVKPSRWNIRGIRRFMLIFGTASSIFDFLTFFLLFFVFTLPERQFQTGWFLESIATQILVVFIIRTKKLPFIESSPARALLAGTLALIVIGWALPMTPLSEFFSFVPLPFGILAMLVGITIVYLGLVEALKRYYFRHEAATV